MVALLVLVPISGLACHLALASILAIYDFFLCLASTQGSGQVFGLETWILN
jgi:hypothetical protein